MADPSPPERHRLVGYRFHPTDQELVGHYLYHELMADDPSIHDTIPEIGVCKYEPQDLLAWATSAASATKFDDYQCYFFSPRDYKYSNGKQLNRTTSRGFWKVTGRDRRIIDKDPNNVIGTKKTLVFYEGRVPHARKTSWIIHEYHDAQLPLQQRTHVLCWLKKNDKHERKEKIHQNVESESILQNKNKRNLRMNLKEHHSLNRKSMVHPSFQVNEATDSMIQSSFQLIEAAELTIQPSSQLNEVKDSMVQPSSQLTELMDLMIQPSSQLNEVTNSIIQPSFQLNEVTDSVIQPSSQLTELRDLMIQPSSQLNEATDLIIQPSSQLNEVTNSVIQPSSQLIKVIDSMIQPISQLNEATNSIIQSTYREDEAVIQPTFQADETTNSMIHLPPESKSAFEAEFDKGEFDLITLWQLPPAPSMDGLF